MPFLAYAVLYIYAVYHFDEYIVVSGLLFDFVYTSCKDSVGLFF